MLIPRYLLPPVAKLAGTLAYRILIASFVDGDAFIDLSSSVVFRDAFGKKLSLVDRNGKKAIGYVHNFGPGETLGPELIVDPDFDDAGSWTNMGTGWSIGGGAAIAVNANWVSGPRQTLSYTINASYRVTKVVAAHTVGAYFGYNWANEYHFHTSAAGVGTKARNFVARSSPANCGILDCGTLTASFSSLSCKRLLTPANTGVYITNLPGGPIRSWLSVDSGFEYNSLYPFTYSLEA